MKRAFPSALMPLSALALAFCASGDALAQVQVDALAVDGGAQPLAAGTVDGVLVRLADEAGFGFACRDLDAGPGELLWTGDTQVLLVGAESRYMEQQGCKWRLSSGAVSGAAIIDVHQSTPGSSLLWWIARETTGNQRLLVSTDRGETSRPTDTFALIDQEVLGLSGEGERLAIVARGGPKAVLWWSEDAGETFAQRDLALPEAPLDSVATLLGDQLFVWTSAGDLIRYALDGDLEGPVPALSDRSFPIANRRPAADGEGGLWVAALDDGLWRRDPKGVWSTVDLSPATAVAFAGGALYVGRRAFEPGQPLVQRSTDLGQTFVTALAAPDALGYAPECASSAPGICEGDAARLLGALGVGEPEPEPEPGPSADGGCGASGSTATGALAAVLLGLGWLYTRRRG